MVKFALQIKATLDNIEMFGPIIKKHPNGCDCFMSTKDSFRWYLKFTCNSCGEEFQKWNYVSMNVHTPEPNTIAVNHFASKCKFCSRENSMTIIKDSVKEYTADDSAGQFQTIVCFDCRGITPIDFSPKEGWVAKASNGGKEFNHVDLSEGEWVEYCDVTNNPVGIYEIECKFDRIK